MRVERCEGHGSLLDANAVPRAAAKGHVESVDAVEVRVGLEPALGAELEGVAEDVRVEQDVAQRHGDGVAGRDDEFLVLERLVGRYQRQARCEEGAEAERLADDGRLWCVSLWCPWATVRKGGATGEARTGSVGQYSPGKATAQEFSAPAEHLASAWLPSVPA